MRRLGRGAGGNAAVRGPARQARQPGKRTDGRQDRARSALTGRSHVRGRLFGDLRVADADVNDPGGPLIVINEVPDSPAAGYLVLPAFQRVAFPDAGSEGSFEPVLPFGRRPGPGIGPDRVE